MVRSSTEDVAGPDGTVLTISVAGDRFPPRTAVAVGGYDAESIGASWLAEPEPVRHEVRVGVRGNRFGIWRRTVSSAEEAVLLVDRLRGVLLTGWTPADGDPPGI